MEPNTQAPKNKMSKRTKTALWLMIAPTALIITMLIITVIMNAVINLNAQPTMDGELFTDSSPLLTVVNFLAFLSGTIFVISFLPGLIIGIVLLTTKAKPRV